MLIPAHSSSTALRRCKKGASRKSGSIFIAFFPPSYLARSILCYRWFGIILLPLVSFSADGTIALWFIIRSSLRSFVKAPEPPDTIAEARAIDMSIQFLLFWTPLVTLIGWWVDKPMTLLFGKGFLYLVILIEGSG